MKLISLLFLLTFYNSSFSQGTVYNLENKKIEYRFEMTSEAINIEVAFIPRTSGDSIYMEMVIDLFDAGENQALFTDFSGDTIVYTMDTKGKIIDPMRFKGFGKDATSVLNTGLFFLEFPGEKIVQGTEWNTDNPVVDMIFSRVETRYYVSKIEKDGMYLISTESEFITEEDGGYTKTMLGMYLLNPVTLEVESASIDVYGFNGFRNFSSAILIYKKGKFPLIK
ncbi:hypothetical protein [Fluviicola sp.]|uniref:hypothetical protein n=1 Tax=Fluviicola sp. TaxID=1917219 RepID=UPI0031CE99F3